MTVWELKSGRVDAFAPLVIKFDDRRRSSLLFADGRPKEWMSPPAVEFLFDKRTKDLPRADVPMLINGALALNSRAKDALGPFLSQFGELVPLDCADEPVWYFNVTTVIDCLDPESSIRRETGSIAKEAFHSDKVPSRATVFKDPAKLRSRIYVNDAGKEAVEKIVAEAGLSGLVVTEPGSA